MLLIVTTVFTCSEIISLSLLLLTKKGRGHVSIVNKFITFIKNYYNDIINIIKNEPVEKREDNENDIFLILYEDNLDAFIPYLNKKINDPQIQNPFLFQDSKYEFLAYYFNFADNSELIYVATILHANKIIKYLLEHQITTYEMLNSLDLVIFRSDFEFLKLFSNFIPFPQLSFTHSLLQPNPEIIKYVYEKSHFRFRDFLIPNSIYHFPHSIVFLLNHMESIAIPHSITYILTCFYIVYRNLHIFKHTLFDEIMHYVGQASYVVPTQHLFTNLPFSLELFEYALKQTHNCYWLQFLGCFVNQANLVSNILINVFKNCKPKVKKKLYESLLNYPAIFIQYLQSMDVKASDFDIKILGGLPLAFYIAMGDNSQLFDLMIEKGYDVNNSKHPENASLIHYASISKNITNLSHLLAVPGLDINRKDCYGRTAIDIANDPSYRVLLINAGCQSSKTSSSYNERDFINSNQTFHIHSIRGPSQNFGLFPILYSYRYSISTSLVCSAVKVSNLSRFSSREGESYEIGSKSKLIKKGPYDFGIINRYVYTDIDYQILTLCGIKKFTVPKNFK